METGLEKWVKSKQIRVRESVLSKGNPTYAGKESYGHVQRMARG